jgi:hypothetical protein
MSDKIVITNETHMSLDMSDIGVKLPGKGSNKIIDIITANKSAIFTDFKRKRWVSCKPYKEPQSMPHWPFHRIQVPSHLTAPSLMNPIISAAPKTSDFENTPAARTPQPVANDSTLSEIRDLLKVLVEKPLSASPEVIAAHVASAVSRQNGGPTPGIMHTHGTIDDAPQFVPNKIIPDKVELSIKKNEVQVEKSNFDDAAMALKAINKKKKQD